MLPISSLSQKALADIQFILSDFDDTLTFNGGLLSTTLKALEELNAVGVKVIPVTGGCAGWSDMMARTLPVSGVISEGGSIFIEKKTNGRTQYHFCVPEHEIRAFQKATLETVQRALGEGSTLKLASDQEFRISDVAIDFAQDVVPPAHKEKTQLLDRLKRSGLNAKVSSIHINITHPEADKWRMSKRVLTDFYCLAESDFSNDVLAVGDAPNDQALFERFSKSVGVANIVRYEKELITPPRYVTQFEGGHGFAELSKLIIAAKST
ncbi:HAD-IIB family hydrolase [Marinomonas mediterranea]|jgi:Predicted hydrolases of the HAD superfamily|uniref:HAD family hydrolase n=1 Tax=Marinomonas mediterranea (strain ATCC 700492 / JCM 21426 / NBRC 103028 / MMB-1) TaxID=717774 RepID=F2JVX9_MARM1|nr:HAD-IIB family hydrolase [Marinomonas mediterranea]ADZ92867.1 HAD family hydrolase [Marinomonas mediterranea MMB-1]WCN18889.1 HAD-IIB family hydrolase [Marinomonas mediterranea MMB-1]